MADIGSLIEHAPPVSRALAGATLVLSFSALALNIINPMYLIYYPPAVFNTTRPEIWRLVTSFLLSRPKLSILLDPYFLYRYASDCETQRFTRPGDFVVFLVFCSSLILALNTFVPFLAGMTFCQPLMVALAYYWTAFEPAASRVNFFIATFPVKFLPFVMLLMTFVQAGLPATLVDASGLVAAHLYLFLTEIWPRYGGGPELVFTPAWVHALFDARAAPPPPPPPPSARPRQGSAAGIPTTPVGGRGNASGSLFGRTQDSWSHRGQGQRLGS